ncbi:HI1450 family dsDNA-mimic protein [Aeromonas caviae]|uniref:HI1450 family dsDNA-mimic protein n=1 Tax=Aeromonas caviae TaxID=648 RepID=UPI0029D731F3|nr:HI1450 family dsDNA-mimic protein [Aeromonas caviae]MDX7825689.1 HI1450 family dsDNA-mimic protein [Aeromonas caviae]
MEQRSPDQLVEWAYDQFLEQAADMLAPEQIVDITLEFEQRGAVEATLPNADWSTELGEPVDMARWAEVWVGLLDHQDEFEVIYATFLLPRDQSEHDVYIRWHRQQQA